MSKPVVFTPAMRKHMAAIGAKAWKTKHTAARRAHWERLRNLKGHTLVAPGERVGRAAGPIHKAHKKLQEAGIIESHPNRRKRTQKGLPPHCWCGQCGSMIAISLAACEILDRGENIMAKCTGCGNENFVKGHRLYGTGSKEEAKRTEIIKAIAPAAKIRTPAKPFGV